MRPLFAAAILIQTVSTAVAQAPWLPEADQEALRKLLPQGVPFADTARAYRLPQVYQAMIQLNEAPHTTVEPVDDAKAEHPWKVSGGMHFSPREQWRNVTALDLGKGKIETWHELVDAGAPRPVWRRFWRFPTGTLAYDILVRRWPLGEERVFEVRVHERLKDGWGNARTFRPDVPAKGVRKPWTWEFAPTLVFANLTESRVSIKAKTEVVHVPAITAKVRFVDRTEVLNDDGYLIPPDYAGAGASCTACHSRTLVGQRTGYGTAVRGNDGRFTWHPWTPAGAIDTRWPLEHRKG